MATLAAAVILGCRWRSAWCSAPISAAASWPCSRPLRAPPEARRLPLGNLLFKLIGCVLAMPILQQSKCWLQRSMLDAARAGRDVPLRLQRRARAALHLLHRPIAARRRAPAAGQARRPDDPKPRNLDPSALDTPPLAIANAAREAMRIGDVVETMLLGMLPVINTNDRDLRASGCATRTTWSTTSTRRSSST